MIGRERSASEPKNPENAAVVDKLYVACLSLHVLERDAQETWAVACTIGEIGGGRCQFMKPNKIEQARAKIVDEIH